MKSTAKKILMTGLVALGISTMITGTALAEDKPEADFSMGAYSQYVWRGFAFSDSSVVLQPSMTVAYKGFGVNFWGNIDTDEVGTEHKNWNETDLTISYDGSAGKIGYGVGWIYYNVDGADESEELYATVSVDTLLAPTLTFYNDIDSYPGYYITLGVGHSLPVGEGMALDLGAQIGFMDDDADYSEFHDALISASMTFAINDYVSVTPELYYSFALTNDAEMMIAGGSVDGEDDHVFGGVSASFAF
jgi:hypothetical protein